MKSLLIIGGFLGFGIGVLFNWSQESAWPSSLWRACLTAYAAGIMMKWWGNSWRKSLEASLRERESMEEESVNEVSPLTKATQFSKAVKS